MRRFVSGVTLSIAAVAAVTGLVYALKPVAPTLSLGVLYVVAVVVVALVRGLAYAIATSVVAMLTFNFLFLPPLHTFALHESANWVALAVYLVTAVVVSELAARSRRRAAAAEQREREATLLADIATELLRGRGLAEETDEVAVRAAGVLGVPSARIELGEAQRPAATESPHLLQVGGRTVGALYTPGGADPQLAVRRRFLPALAALLAVAVDRERLEREAREAETLRHSDLVKTALLRAVSHDLRSPLTGIRAAVEALRSPALHLADEDRAELLETIDVDSRRLSRLVDDLLDLSRLEAGAAVPETELWSLDDLVRQAIDDVDAADRVEIAGEAPYVHVDAAQVRRALANLLENALAFSPAGTNVNVHVAATSEEAIVRVVDHGPGLPPEELERVFEPFYRGADRARSGAGLGLAIARGFAAGNGGRVWAESGPGRGATFALALPVVEVPAELAW